MLTRRQFLATTATATAAVTLGKLTAQSGSAEFPLGPTARSAASIQNRESKIQNQRASGARGALYYRAQLYTIVPSQVRDDLAWMRDAGLNFLVIGLLEQDLDSARENIDLICSEAQRANLRVWLTPSRWGNLLAGALKVPCTFTGKNPDCWARKPDGKPIMAAYGPYASIHHPYTYDNFARLLRRALAQWPVAGIIWDEPKAYNLIDHSPAAQKTFNNTIPPDVRPHRQAFAKFFSRLNTDIIKPAAPDCLTAMFTYATLTQPEADDLADQPGLDAFGCDGRPWSKSDNGPDDTDRTKPSTKNLIDDGPRFIETAKRHGRQSIALIENHALPASANPLMTRRLPEVLAQNWDILMCYYYPRSCESPDESMTILKTHLSPRQTA